MHSEYASFDPLAFFYWRSEMYSRTERCFFCFSEGWATCGCYVWRADVRE